MTKSKMIVVWGSEDILSAYIRCFLAVKEDWKVVSISNNEEQDTFIQAVETMQPDIVIIIQMCNGDSSKLPLQLFDDHPAIKVIMIGLENNMIDVYSKQKILVREASDLITVIENTQNMF